MGLSTESFSTNARTDGSKENPFSFWGRKRGTRWENVVAEKAAALAPIRGVNCHVTKIMLSTLASTQPGAAKLKTFLIFYGHENIRCTLSGNCARHFTDE